MSAASRAIRRAAFYHVDTDGLAAIYRAHGRVFEGARDGFFHSAVERSLRFFASQGARATYFVIASDLRDKEKRAALREVVAAGHAVASHGLHHRYLDRSTPAEKREEIFDGKTMIEQELGARVLGFRAPGYALDAESLDLLAEAGFAYDSSITPGFAFREKLGLQRLYPDPFEILPDRGLMEFPLPAPPPGLPAFHPCFAFYLRRAYFRAGLRSHAKRADHLTLLFHFTDFAEKQDEVSGLGLQLFTNNFFSGDAKQAFLAKLAADEQGTREYNLALGAKRASAVQDFLISQGVQAILRSQLQVTSRARPAPSRRRQRPITVETSRSRLTMSGFPTVA